MAWSEGLEWSRVEIVMLMMLMMMMMTIMHLRLGFLFLGLRDEFCIKPFYILFCTRMN